MFNEGWNGSSLVQVVEKSKKGWNESSLGERVVEKMIKER
jgi:hypothetical protein